MPQRISPQRREQIEKVSLAPPLKSDTPPVASRSVAVWTLALLLVVITLALYSPVRKHPLVNYDDVDYILNNPHVTAGINWETFRWSLISTEKSNWHPLTWLSHALDCQLFGLDAGWHHVTSLVLHTLNVLLLFLLLRYATGATGCSFVVAALFAWHPFNVESVAWIAERKNLLSTLFLLVTLGAYGWYARKPDLKRLMAVSGIFVLALASKPMVVTLPFLLLLLDYWPLQRVAGWTSPSSRIRLPQKRVRDLLIEKWPLFFLSAASSAVTLWAQKTGRAIESFEGLSLGTRVENALHSYAMYIWKTFYPTRFSVLYPHPGSSLAVWKPILAALLLCAISVVAWKLRTAYPYFLVGWLWFLGTLVPVIGIIQVGEQAMADRYAYVPLIGIFVIAAWGAADLCDRIAIGKLPRIVAIVFVLSLLSFLSFRQLGYWGDSISLWSHARQVTPENLTVEEQLASLLIDQGDSAAAMPHLLNVAKLNPTGLWSHIYLGTAYMAEGRLQDAAAEFEITVKYSENRDLTPANRRFRSSALLNLGIARLLSEDFSKASASFQTLSQFDPEVLKEAINSNYRAVAAAPSQVGYVKLSLLLCANGQDAKALSILNDALTLNPDYQGVRELLGYLTAQNKLRGQGSS